ncbi:MAG: DUF1048 domain-containing protein [Enterococcus lacertideformus]|uniref:DUF1048 domain-containing protein n=1 Tax=Enterococcus lacertideformus TaxID=2771493 RepID=A0A931AY07_9ENTE|nr:DUF1048 domain-containing protein [Enterococcus lacertideformus]
MGIREMIKEKKIWQYHMNRIKQLPQEYQIVYKESQKYLFKVAPVEISESTTCLLAMIDLFEEGARNGKKVLDITGEDVAAFCDDLCDGVIGENEC